MKTTDLIMLNVTGTNGTTRNQKTISRRFNGLGQDLDDNGQPSGKADVLRNLPIDGQSSKAPDFPTAAFVEAQAKGDAATLKQIQIAYAEQFSQWEKSQGGGNENLQVAKSALEYTKEFHGFREEDGDHFVMKLENLDVVTTTLKDGRTLYTVAGTAVFGL
jgi:hypothetical protein